GGPRGAGGGGEGPPPVGGTVQRVEEAADARRVGRREARRAHAGGARERVDLETGVVGENGQPGGRRHRTRLQQGVLGVRRSVLLRQPAVREVCQRQTAENAPLHKQL